LTEQLHYIDNFWTRVYQAPELQVSLVVFHKLFYSIRTITDRVAILGRLAHCLRRRFEQHSQKADIAASITLAKELLAICESAREEYCAALITLATSFYLQYLETSSSIDLDEAAAYSTHAVRICDFTSPLQAAALNALGCMLRRKFLNGTWRDYGEVLSLHRKAVQIARSPAHPEKARSLNQLANDLWIIHAYRGDEGCLEESIEVYGEALNASSCTRPDWPEIVNGKASALRLRFQQKAAPADIDEAIALYDGLLKICPSDTAIYPRLAQNLAAAHSVRFNARSIADDLDRAIQLYEACLLSLPQAHPSYSHSVVNLAVALRDRWASRGSISDLDSALQLSRSAVEQTDPASGDYPAKLVCLVGGLDARWSQYGRIEDLEEAIAINRRILDLCPSPHPTRLYGLHNLADSLMYRYDIIPDDADIDEVLSLHKESLASRPPGHPRRGRTLISLSSALRRRFEATDDVRFLDEAGRSLEEALELCADDPSFRCDGLLAYTQTLLLRSRFRGISDLEKAIENCRIVLEIYESEHSRRHTAFRFLSQAHLSRYHLLHETSDSNDALKFLSNALMLLRPGHNARSKCLTEMAALYMEELPYHSLSVAFRYLKDGVNDAHRSARLRLMDATRVLHGFSSVARHIPVDHELRTQIVNVYRDVVSLVPRTLLFGIKIASRLQLLRPVEDVILDGASFALLSSNVEAAIEILEQGRGVFWTESLRLRTPFDTLPQELRDEIQAISSELEHAVYSDPGETRPRQEWEASRRRKQSERFDSLVSRARTYPGLEHFLLPDPFSAISAVAEHGPVVILVSSSVCSHAIILQKASGPLHVSLSDLTEKWLAESGKHWRQVATDQNQTRLKIKKQSLASHQRDNPDILQQYKVLADLWSIVIQPILNALNLTVRSCSSNLNKPPLM
jgi:tetratricopeptide (TPR) repeat protein